MQLWFPPLFIQWFNGLNSHLRCETSPSPHHPPVVFQKGQCSWQNRDADFRYGKLFPGSPGAWEMGCVWWPLQHFLLNGLGIYQAGGGRYLRSHLKCLTLLNIQNLVHHSGEKIALRLQTEVKKVRSCNTANRSIGGNGGTMTQGVEMSKLVSHGSGIGTFHKGETPFGDTNVSALSLK